LSGVRQRRTDATAGKRGEKRLLKRSEVSKLLGVSPNTVTRWAREGRLPSQATLGGHHRFDSELVEELRRRLCRASNPE
jgi:excisionase family DNA binding protein